MAGSTVATVRLWGMPIGAVAWDAGRELGSFEYTPEFRESPIEPAPLTMPVGQSIHAFPELARETFHGLPGLLADSLPDRFGNRVIDAWLARTGRSAAEFSPVDRLLYIGKRGMGALEFEPSTEPREHADALDVSELTTLANDILAERTAFHTSLADDTTDHRQAIQDILRVGVSAGGARAKAIIAWNRKTGEVRSGQTTAPKGFEHWLLKLDGVSNNRDKEALADPLGYGQIEYAYYLMARAAGIDMSECRLFEENGRHHFMTRRFDRGIDGDKRHTQTLCAIAHLDFNEAGAHSYEQAFQVITKLGLGKQAIEEMFRRMAFNIAARNQDDHTKNIAFLMNRAGSWSLAPAYDLTLAYNPQGRWTNRHQMTINGKREAFSVDDLLAVAKRFRITMPRARAVLSQVNDAVLRWPDFAEQAGVGFKRTAGIAAVHRKPWVPTT